jgi:hypothetical protein
MLDHRRYEVHFQVELQVEHRKGSINLMYLSRLAPTNALQITYRASIYSGGSMLTIFTVSMLTLAALGVADGFSIADRILDSIRQFIHLI